MQIKRLALFERLLKILIKNPGNYILEHRVFIAASFVGAMAGLLSTTINLSLSLHPILIFTTSVITVIYFFFYYLSVRKKIYKILVLPYIFISLFTLVFLWFINGGSNGPVSYILVTALLVYILLTRGPSRITALAVVVITITALYLWEYLHPELIINYIDAESKYLDIYFTALFSIGLIAFIGSFIVKNYDEERKMVMLQRDKIIEQNKEINETHQALIVYQENLEELVKLRTQELEETNKQLVIARDKAEESDRLKTAFLSNMSHEIRTPMNAIIGFSYLMKDPKINSETLNQYIDIIQSKGLLLLNLINDILDISKVEAGEIEIKKETCSLNHLMKELYSTFSLILENSKNLNIELKSQKPDKNEDVFISTDTFRLKQVLSNLIDNAIKFTNNGFVEFGYKIIDEPEEKRIYFYVADSGIGISLEHTGMIFTRFRQIQESHTREFGGTGLGLSISKKLVELLGGKLEVNSTLNQGSTFYFSLPYYTIETKNENSINQSSGNLTYNWKNKTILIVEDNHSGFELLANYLLHTGAKILHADNGKDAVDLCRSNSDIDLVLMDIQLPELNGYEATVFIKQHRKDLPVIAETAHAQAEDSSKAKLAGCDDYLSKPIDRGQLLLVLSKYLVD
jgi:signal transduction histidine kinase